MNVYDDPSFEQTPSLPEIVGEVEVNPRVKAALLRDTEAIINVCLDNDFIKVHVTETDFFSDIFVHKYSKNFLKREYPCSEIYATEREGLRFYVVRIRP